MTSGTIHLETDYAEMARRPLDAEKCVLFVVDIQEKLLPPIWERERLLRNSQLLTRLAGILEASGANLHHVVKTTVFLKDMNDFAAMNEVYGRFFTAASPARSTVQVARLPKDALVEIEVIASL